MTRTLLCNRSIWSFVMSCLEKFIIILMEKLQSCAEVGQLRSGRSLHCCEVIPVLPCLSIYLRSCWNTCNTCKWHSLCTRHCISHSAPQGEEQHLLWLPCSQNLQDWWQLVIWLMNPLCLVGEKSNLNCIWKMCPVQRCRTAISDYYRSS